MKYYVFYNRFPLVCYYTISFSVSYLNCFNASIVILLSRVFSASDSAAQFRFDCFRRIELDSVCCAHNNMFLNMFTDW